jgi:hypothetical protein
MITRTCKMTGCFPEAKNNRPKLRALLLQRKRLIIKQFGRLFCA